VIKVIATKAPLSLDLIGNQDPGVATRGRQNPISQLIAASTRVRDEDSDPQWGAFQVGVAVSSKALATASGTKPKE
jgi:hypothetical protein